MKIFLTMLLVFFAGVSSVVAQTRVSNIEDAFDRFSALVSSTDRCVHVAEFRTSCESSSGEYFHKLARIFYDSGMGTTDLLGKRGEFSLFGDQRDLSLNQLAEFADILVYGQLEAANAPGSYSNVSLWATDVLRRRRLFFRSYYFRVEVAEANAYPELYTPPTEIENEYVAQLYEQEQQVVASDAYSYVSDSPAQLPLHIVQLYGQRDAASAFVPEESHFDDVCISPPLDIPNERQGGDGSGREPPPLTPIWATPTWAQSTRPPPQPLLLQFGFGFYGAGGTVRADLRLHDNFSIGGKMFSSANRNLFAMGFSLYGKVFSDRFFYAALGAGWGVMEARKTSLVVGPGLQTRNVETVTEHAGFLLSPEIGAEFGGRSRNSFLRLALGLDILFSSEYIGFRVHPGILLGWGASFR